jgi:hypothetical protein
MTNKYNNWERLSKVIERFRLSINAFANQLGLGRSENLYHIRKGNYGISHDLANRIIKHDADIDRTWLLSGVGTMLRSDPKSNEALPFYRDRMEVVLLDLDNAQPYGYFDVPYVTGSDFIVRSFARPMVDTVTVATDLFLKRLSSTDEIVQGNEYVFKIDESILWRRVRCVKGSPTKWRLVARNREEYPDIVIDNSSIDIVWRVISRVAILES